MCSGSHRYFKCLVYKTPNEKLKRLRELKGCDKCGLLNHTVKNCKLNRLRCKICSGAHFPSLCPNSDQSGKKYYNNTAWVSHAFMNCSGDDLVLPTFTVDLSGITTRVMRDTGSQMNFVTEDLVSKCNLRVLKQNVSLTLSGFNSDREFTTEIVEIILLDVTIIVLWWFQPFPLL